MRTLYIERADDPRVEEYQGMLDPKLMRARGLFVAEGRLVVARMIEDPRYRVRSLLLSGAAHRALEPALERLDDDVPVYVCAAEHFLPMTGVDIHRGCLALVERPPAIALEDLLSSARRLVLLDTVSNADNVGSVFRNAAAFGVDAVVLSATSCDPLYRKAIRTSMSATLRIPFARADDWPEALGVIRAAGFRIVALTPREPSETLDLFAARERPDRLALIVGAEGTGLSEASEAAAHYHVRIPTTAEVDSLNLAVASGIALSRLMDGRSR